MTYLSPEDLKTSLPRYRSHKVVQAARILEVRPLPLRFRLDVGDDFEQRWFQPKALASTVQPEPGWYLVVYEGGYISFSPAKAFEEGYVPLGDGVALTTASHPEGSLAQAPTLCGAVNRVTDGFSLYCNLVHGHDGAHRDDTSHGWGYEKAAPPAPAVLRTCGTLFEVGSGRISVTCTYPAGHEGPHGRAFPHT